jgi:hypothetical protein
VRRRTTGLPANMTREAWSQMFPGLETGIDLVSQDSAYPRAVLWVRRGETVHSVEYVADGGRDGRAIMRDAARVVAGEMRGEQE